MTRIFSLGLLLVLTLVIFASCTNAKDPSPQTLSQDPMVQQGAQLAKENSCMNCHSADGSRRSGPTFKNLAGSERSLSNGTSVIADDEYLHRSVVDPDNQIVKGYKSGSMSAATSRKKLDASEVDAIVAYIKALK